MDIASVMDFDMFLVGLAFGTALAVALWVLSVIADSFKDHEL